MSASATGTTPPGTPLTVRAARAGDPVAAWLRRSWGETTMAFHGRLYDMSVLPAIVALRDDQIVGVLTYTVEGDSHEIVSCDVSSPRQGIGRRLVEALVEQASEAGAASVLCTTTNDNLAALGFWQALGFRLKAVRPDAVQEARRLKPTIPETGTSGLPIRDELDLELSLEQPSRASHERAGSTQKSLPDGSA